MKNTFLAFPILVFVACSGNQPASTPPKNSDLVQQNLKGKVQTLEERWVNYDSLGNAKSDSGVNTSSFDANGYVTTMIGKDSSGSIAWEQKNLRNNNGLLTELNGTKNGKQVWRLTLESDDKGYTAAKEYDSTLKQTSYYTDIKTNEFGLVYAAKQHFMDGRIKSTFETVYEGVFNAGGKSTDSTGKVSYTGTNKADASRNVIEEHSTSLEKDSTVTHDYTYQYEGQDEAGNWLTRIQYDKGKKTIEVTRTITYYKN